jgi:hypothetical protein
MTGWGPGYTQAELRVAQDKFGLRFPPDLIALLRRGRLPGGHDWTADEQRIRDMLAWPLEGILFDVEQGLWWPEWGARPTTPEERAEIVGAVIADAPKLIPLFGHRFIPEEPCEAGNPVFSVHQSDIVYYGADLANYITNEFSVPHQYVLRDGIRPIRFWADAVARSGDPVFWPFEGQV